MREWLQRSYGEAGSQIIKLWRDLDFVWSKFTTVWGLVALVAGWVVTTAFQLPVELRVLVAFAVALAAVVLVMAVQPLGRRALGGLSGGTRACRRLVHTGRVPGLVLRRSIRDGRETEVRVEAIHFEFVNDRPNEVRIYEATLELRALGKWWAVPLHRLVPTGTVDLQDLPLVLPAHLTPLEGRYDLWFRGEIGVPNNQFPRPVDLRVRFKTTGTGDTEIVCVL